MIAGKRITESAAVSPPSDKAESTSNSVQLWDSRRSGSAEAQRRLGGRREAARHDGSAWRSR